MVLVGALYIECCKKTQQHPSEGKQSGLDIFGGRTLSSAQKNENLPAPLARKKKLPQHNKIAIETVTTPHHLPFAQYLIHCSASYFLFPLASPLHLSAFITVSYTPSIFLSQPFPLPPLLHLNLMQHSLIWSFLPFTTHFSFLSFQLFILVNTIFFQLHSVPLLLIAFPCFSSVSHFN